jgi:hypothetical protein
MPSSAASSKDRWLSGRDLKAGGNPPTVMLDQIAIDHVCLHDIGLVSQQSKSSLPTTVLRVDVEVLSITLVLCWQTGTESIP